MVVVGAVGAAVMPGIGHGEPVRGWKAINFVASLDLAHAADSWGQRVFFEGSRAVGEAYIFDGWP